MKITSIKVENLSENCITDEARPRVSFAFESENNGAKLKSAQIAVNGWRTETENQVLIPYEGAPLKPFTKYTVSVTACDNFGDSAEAQTEFETGRLGTKWQAKWITDGSYNFTEKKVSPVPLTFVKKFKLENNVVRAVINCTALGIYELNINGKKAGEDYFAPGFTSYETTLQYQTYDVTSLLSEENEICAVVAGGWAVGSFVFTRKNRITADRQALLLELRVTYADGSEQIIGTDESWGVTREGNYRSADFYDGETFDNSVDLSKIKLHSATVENIKINPRIVAAFGAPVRVREELKPVSRKTLESGEVIYDFGQNFAGVIRAKINGRRGQKIIFRHAEILKKDGTLFTELLRSAKQTATFICAGGEQEYSPKLTYMGFRYVGVSGVDINDLELSAYVLSSDLEKNGNFECSDERINRLQQNILWSSKSNLFDIPTDCPQRDERMGWTGDIAVFAPTACFNFDMSRFLEKWLNDVKHEQLKSGGIPNTVPVQGYGFPATMPAMAVDFWGDACILVPWAEYLARGDKEILRKNYPVMKKYVKACKFWANIYGLGKYRYIWHTPSLLHFGDWLAPDTPKMSGWQKRSKWTATASLCHTSGLLSKIAALLGEKEDEKYYKDLSEKVAKAYISVFTDGNGKLKKEFQTAYVLPLAFNMFAPETRAKAVDNLVKLVKANNYRIATGFPGTPYILFALADNGRVEDAFKMLLNDSCPSWLYEVKAGATTIWERWDALKEDGTSNLGAEDGTGGMISFNHYASGAVGEFLYRRVLGIDPVEGGYKKFKIAPLAGYGLTSAKGCVNTPYGVIACEWKIVDGSFTMDIEVPANTECAVSLPSGEKFTVGSGKYNYRCAI